MHKVFVTVTATTDGLAKLTSYPYRPDGIKYEVPLYVIKVEGTDAAGNNVVTKFKAIRFGIKRTRDLDAHMVGLQDAQSYTLSWSYITTMREMAWRVYSGFFVHRGPEKPLAGQYGSIGCIEICGVGQWDKFNNLIKTLAACETMQEVSTNRYAKITYIAATKPALKKL